MVDKNKNKNKQIAVLVKQIESLKNANKQNNESIKVREKLILELLKS